MAELDFIPSAVAPGESTLLAEVSGFTNANFYAEASGTLVGSATMSSVVLARLKHGQGTGIIEVMHGNFRSGGVGGWQVGKDGLRFKHYLTDGTPTQVENAVEADFSTPSFAADFSSGTHVLVGQTYDGTSSRLYINGRLQNVRTPGGAGFTPSGSTYKWGLIAFQLLDPFQGAICGAAVDEGQVLTEDQMFDYWLAVKDGLDVVDGGLGWEHRWTLNGIAVGAAPATLADAGSVGGLDLTLTGALTVAEHRYDWFRF